MSPSRERVATLTRRGPRGVHRRLRRARTHVSSLTMSTETRNVPPSCSSDVVDDANAFVDRLLDDVFDGAHHFEATSPFPLAGSAQHRAPSVTMRQSFNPTKTCTSCKRKNLIAAHDFDPDRKTCRACLRTQRRRHALKVRAEFNRALAATGDATRRG